MTDNDITTICGKIESLHDKILKSKFSEMVTESEMICLVLAVQELNRQKAEIERLTKEQKLFADIGKMYSEVKAEAIKEFAERLTSKVVNTPFGVNCSGETDEYKEGCLRGLVAKQHNVLDMINNLVKEMVGDSDV